MTIFGAIFSGVQNGIFRALKCTFGLSGFRGAVGGPGDCKTRAKVVGPGRGEKRRPPGGKEEKFLLCQARQSDGISFRNYDMPSQHFEIPSEDFLGARKKPN